MGSYSDRKPDSGAAGRGADHKFGERTEERGVGVEYERGCLRGETPERRTARGAVSG